MGGPVQMARTRMLTILLKAISGQYWTFQTGVSQCHSSDLLKIASAQSGIFANPPFRGSEFLPVLYIHSGATPELVYEQRGEA